MIRYDRAAVTPRQTVELLKLAMKETNSRKLRRLLFWASSPCTRERVNKACTTCPLRDYSNDAYCFVRRYMEDEANETCGLSFVVKRGNRLLKKVFFADAELHISKWNAAPNRILYELG